MKNRGTGWKRTEKKRPKKMIEKQGKIRLKKYRIENNWMLNCNGQRIMVVKWKNKEIKDNPHHIQTLIKAVTKKL